MGRRGKPTSRRIKAGRATAQAEVDELAATREAPDATRLSILDAGEALFSKKGFARANVEEIAKAAGVTSDVFYGHFAGKGALLRALTERFYDQMVTVTDQATRSGIWRDASPRDVIEVAVRSVLDVIFDREGLVRAILAHGATDPALVTALRKIGTHLVTKLNGVVGETNAKPGERPDGRAVAFSLLLTVSLAHHEILVGGEWSGTSFPREELASEAARAVTAYLTSRSPS